MSGEVKHFDCADCLGFCCSVYNEVNIKVSDVVRIALYRRLSLDQAVERYTNPGLELKRKPDPLLKGHTCIFFDTTKRGCGIYEARPDVCRDWPKSEHAVPGAEGRCAYYDVYKYAQRELAHNVVPLVQIGRRVGGETHVRQG